jgi:hypothetical protein
MALNRAGSASYPVAISRPVSGHLIMTVPIPGLLQRERRRIVSILAGYERRLTLARQSRGKRKKYHRRKTKKQQDVISRRSRK